MTLLTHIHLTRSLETTILLTACFVVEFVVRVYLCDPLIRLIGVKNAIEAKHGLGMEVGKLSHDSTLFASEEYASVHLKFRRLHMFIAFSNIACIGFSTAHLYIAVSNINFNTWIRFECLNESSLFSRTLFSYLFYYCTKAFLNEFL